MSEVIDSMWSNTAQGSFGIILAEDKTTGERKLYAGVAVGLDQQADEQAILSWGNEVNLGMLASLLARALGKTGILLRAEVDGKWGSYDIENPMLSDEAVLQWIREKAIGDDKFYPRLVMILLGRIRDNVK